MLSMAEALVARQSQRLTPSLFSRVLLRSFWSSFSAEVDPSSNTTTTTSVNPASSSSSAQTRHKKVAYRLSAVVDAVNERKLPPELRGRGNAIRSETDIVNVVEQRIWHSMEEGHFENLPGKGKPLNLNTNPHVDPAEDTLYRILSRNGCAPEWVELNKEIRSNIAEWRLALKKAWTERSDEEASLWLQNTENLKARMKDINGKVLRYNLMVPFGRQMFGLKWEKEMDSPASRRDGASPAIAKPRSFGFRDGDGEPLPPVTVSQLLRLPERGDSTSHLSCKPRSFS